ncbi:DUF2306 domain-containing protein [Brachybacterium sp. YJGR34]|uniref:DUF2306 domain-containing protein n=1 Tax=Brachybacterium sp. YJGR34 TaxID=2059911 RepID=UPI000E0B2259|nr:DUF2306 domain-containing protein [Brachybacterium sp. YJGR34]
MDTFTPVIAAHAICALYVLLLGPVQILRRRRDRAHRLLGTSWVAAMVLVCATSFAIMPDGFSWLHGLSIWTLVCLVLAITAIRRGSVPVHRGFMVGSYLGTLAAFSFAALVPARLIPRLLQSDPLIAAATVLAVGAAVAVAVLLALRPAPAEAAAEAPARRS